MRVISHDADGDVDVRSLPSTLGSAGSGLGRRRARLYWCAISSVSPNATWPKRAPMPSARLKKARVRPRLLGRARASPARPHKRSWRCELDRVCLHRPARRRARAQKISLAGKPRLSFVAAVGSGDQVEWVRVARCSARVLRNSPRRCTRAIGPTSRDGCGSTRGPRVLASTRPAHQSPLGIATSLARSACASPRSQSAPGKPSVRELVSATLRQTVEGAGSLILSKMIFSKRSSFSKA